MPDDVNRTGELHVYHHDGVALHGEVFRPTGKTIGRAALVVHEADGIGGNVRRHCARLADLGYVALAADMHGQGRVLAGEAMQDALDRFRSEPDHVRSRVSAAHRALVELSGLTSDRIVALGFCFGGFAVLELARSGADLRAVASFHGLLTTARPAVRGRIKASVAAFTGAKDPLVPPQDIASFLSEMGDADADWHLGVYGQALHSFTNRDVSGRGDARMAYDSRAHDLSWNAMLDFFDACCRT